MRWLDGITDSMDVSLSELWELVGTPGVWFEQALPLIQRPGLETKNRPQLLRCTDGEVSKDAEEMHDCDILKRGDASYLDSL